MTDVETSTAAIPLPADLRIETVGPDVPAEAARFAGAWANGAWYGILPVGLVVESVSADGLAEVVYARGLRESHENYSRLFNHDSVANFCHKVLSRAISMVPQSCQGFRS